jgi:hypothetical protein
LVDHSCFFALLPTAYSQLCAVSQFKRLSSAARKPSRRKMRV